MWCGRPRSERECRRYQCAVQGSMVQITSFRERDVRGIRDVWLM
jgi:hypothetical protein